MSIKLKKIDEYRWEVPKSGSMRVPGIIYSMSSMLEEAQQQEPQRETIAQGDALPHGQVRNLQRGQVASANNAGTVPQVLG